jgi:hypothetical protein
LRRADEDLRFSREILKGRTMNIVGESERDVRFQDEIFMEISLAQRTLSDLEENSIKILEFPRFLFLLFFIFKSNAKESNSNFTS